MAKPIADVAKVFQALSDETRLLILEQLKDGEQCVCELRVLKEAGLVLDRPEGRWVYYSLNPDALEELQEAVNSLNRPSGRSAKKGCCP